MPELPEVETLCRQLREVIVGAQIKEVRILDAKLGSPPEIKGRTVVSVVRRGKMIGIQLDDHRTIRLHLRMTGRLLWQDDATSSFTPDYSRLTVLFSNGRFDFIDPRRFATFHVDMDTVEAHLSPDPIEDFNVTRLRKIAGSRKVSVKSFLMDQRVISGIGNIYACEILHEAKVDPAQQVADLSTAQWRRIAKATVPILNKAIACRGTTVSDWRDLFGRPGEYQEFLKVYAKEGFNCSCCRCKVRRISLGGRGTYYCPSCQKQ